MAKSWLVKGSDGALRGVTEDDVERIKSWPVGTAIECETRRPRNGRHHRKGMALLQYVFDNQDRIDTFEHFLIEVKLATGHVETYITSDGAIIYLPKSIAFDKMDEDEFTRWKSDCFTVIFNRFIGLVPEEEQQRIIDNVIGFM